MRTVPGVLVDRVNIGGNETGQQSNFTSKGTRRRTPLDPRRHRHHRHVGRRRVATYYNFDNFEEVQVSTAGQDIKQPTGGLGVNFVSSAAPTHFRGSVRGYFDERRARIANVPDELRIAASGHAGDADHNEQISDCGFDVGGPIVARPGVVLRVLFDAGRPPRAPRGRARRQNLA